MSEAEPSPGEPLDPEEIPVELPPDEPHVMLRDPVCGAAVNPNAAPARSQHAGETYFFCSSACREVFDADPRRYTGFGRR
jgi:YHS domain-containing protein